MSLPGGSDLMVLARRVLLDALEALSDQRDALVLIGAQAIYLHTGAAGSALPATTKDSDLAIDRRRLSDDPLLEDAMSRGGFELGKDPGSWLGTMGIPVDLMVPESMSDPGGRRGGRVPPHSKRATRRASGLGQQSSITRRRRSRRSTRPTADHSRSRSPGSAALLVAKLHKLGDRDQRDPTRLNDKDAHDVYRLLVAGGTEDLARTLKMLLSSELAAEPTHVALDYFNELFVSGPEALDPTWPAAPRNSWEIPPPWRSPRPRWRPTLRGRSRGDLSTPALGSLTFDMRPKCGSRESARHRSNRPAR